MPRTKKTSSASESKKISTPSGRKTAAQVKADLTKQRQIDFSNLVENQLSLVNLAKTDSRTYQTYSKDRLRTYLRNPKSNENNLRQLSKFLYRMCYPYRRMIWYNATMFDFNAVSVIPFVDFSKDLSQKNYKKLQKSYYQTAKKYQQMNLQLAMLPMLLTAFREDAAFGYIYDDGETFFIYVLDGQYCRISTIDGGILRYAFDFSYFTSHPDDLEFWDTEFKTKYNAYQNGTAEKWQELDYSREICIKVNLDDYTMCYPPYAPLFEQVIDNVDLESIQNVKDELSIYKLLIGRLQPLSGTDTPDDFEVDPKTALKYWQKFEQNLPPEVSSAISPLPIESISFDPTTTTDNDMISQSTSNLFKNSGGSQLLYNDKTGTTIALAQIKMDTETSLSSLLPQIEEWCNIYMQEGQDSVGKDAAHVKFIHTSYLIREEKKKELINSAQYGVPDKLAVAALDGFTPLESLSLMVLENDVFKLHEKWIPLMSSFTRSSSDTTGEGAPTKDDDELTDDGSKSRENKT